MPPATTSQAAMQNLQGFQSNMKSPDQALQDAQTASGVPQAQQQVSGLRSAIQNSTSLLSQVAPSVMGRTANSLVTSAQADRQIGNEQAPINEQLNKEQTDYTNANQDYTNAEAQAQAKANALIGGQQNQLSYLQNVYNDLYTQEQNSAQQAEARREFDAQQALSQQSLAAQRAAATTPHLVGGGGSNNANSALAGIAMGRPGSFQFSQGGAPVKGYAWSVANGVDPLTTLSYMVSKGDANAGNAIRDIQAAGGITSQVKSKYPGFF